MACETCEDQVLEGVCKSFTNSDCIYVSEELTCTGVQANTVLTAALKRIDEVICQIKDKVAGTLALINIGGGAKIYKGLSSIGERQLRTITSTNGTVSIVEGTDTIDLSVIIDIPEVPSATETEEGTVRQATVLEVEEGINNNTYVTPLYLKTFVNENGNTYSIQIVAGNLELLENGIVTDSEPLPIGIDTFPNSFTINGTSLIIGLNNGDSLTRDIASLLNFQQVQSDFTMEDTNDASYIKNRNPSKTVFANYVVGNTDNNYVIVVDSTNGAVTITVPNTIPNKHAVGFIQKGTNLVTIANADIVMEGHTNTLKGQGHQAFIEKIEGIKFLFGSLNKAV